MAKLKYYDGTQWVEVESNIPNNSLTEAKMANEMKKGIVGGVESYDDALAHKAENATGAHKAKNIELEDTTGLYDSEDVEAALAEVMDEVTTHKAEKATLTNYAHVQTGVISLTLLSTNWVGVEAPYTQTLTATGVTAGEVGTVDVDLSGVALYADQTAITDAWGNVHRVVASANNEVTVYVNEVPTVNIPFTVKVVRG